MMIRQRTFFKLTVAFLYVIAAFWVAFGALWLFHQSDYRWFYATSAFSNAIVLAMLTYLMSRGRRWAYWLLVILMAANVVLTVMDQIGWFDLAYLVPALGALIFLMKVKNEVAKITSGQKTIK